MSVTCYHPQYLVQIITKYNFLRVSIRATKRQPLSLVIVFESFESNNAAKDTTMEEIFGTSLQNIILRANRFTFLPLPATSEAEFGRSEIVNTV